jgi:hypothetical protein
VYDSQHQSVAGVTITDGLGHFATTQSDGSYTLTTLTAGIYSVTPSKPGYVFDPASRLVLATPDAAGAEFVAEPVTYVISGRITDTGNPPLENVTVSDGAGHSAAPTDGYYYFTGMAAGTYTLTASKAGYELNPASRTVTVPHSAWGQDFEVLSYKITGRIANNFNDPMSGVSVSGGFGRTSLTGSDGTYEFAGLAPGTFTITPFKQGFYFSPSSRSVAVPPDAAEQDFSTGGQVETFSHGIDITPAHMEDIPASMAKVRAIGFHYAQYYVSWRDLQPKAYDYIRWDVLDPVVTGAIAQGVTPVLRIYQAPAWAAAAPTEPAPASSYALALFVKSLVQRYGTLVGGYVIWNEPNIPIGWENRTVNAQSYVDMLALSYQYAKQANPNVIVVSANLAPTAGGNGAISDLAYLDQMYDAGLANYADIVGMSGMGFGRAPDDTSDPNGYNFSRLAALRQVMVDHGDSAKKAWALEVGWVADTPAYLGDFESWKVSERLQGLYLRRAMKKAVTEWYWLSSLFIWNLNFGPNSAAPEMAAFAIENRPAYNCVSRHTSVSGSCASTVSGRIVDPAGAPMSGVSVTDGAGHTVTSGADGAYLLSGLAVDRPTYAITPTKPGYVFTPASRSVAVPPDATGQNFVAARQTYLPLTTRGG